MTSTEWVFIYYKVSEKCGKFFSFFVFFVARKMNIQRETERDREGLEVENLTFKPITTEVLKRSTNWGCTSLYAQKSCLQGVGGSLQRMTLLTTMFVLKRILVSGHKKFFSKIFLHVFVFFVFCKCTGRKTEIFILF